MSSVWVKNQIWSPDQLESEIPFVTFSVQRGRDVATSPRNFSVGSANLERLLEDEEIKTYIEDQIQKRLKMRLFETLQRLKPELEFHCENIENLSSSDLEALISERESKLINSNKEIRRKLEEQAQKLEHTWDEIVETFLKEREQKLSEHEAQWRKALGHIVEKMQFCEKEKRIQQISSWVQENVHHFNENQKLTVYTAPEDLKDISDLRNNPSSSPKWSVLADENLRSGTVRIEAEHAGLIFDPEKNLKTLVEMLERD